MTVEGDEARRVAEGAFAAVLGAGRGSDREDPWWHDRGPPTHGLAYWLDAAVAHGHDRILLDMNDDGSWRVEARGGHPPMHTGHRHPAGAEWLLERAPDSHALPGNEATGWTWRLR